MLRIGCALALAGARGAAASGARARAPGSAPPLPSDPSDRRIARLGAVLWREDPATARRLARLADAQLPAWLRLAGPSRRARALRPRLLAPARLAGELDRGEVLVLDGWVLARSEAAVAAWLHLRLAAERAAA